jgi:hypothetical protein
LQIIYLISMGSYILPLGYLDQITGL